MIRSNPLIKKAKLLFCIIALILYIISLTQPAFSYRNHQGPHTMESLPLLVMGGTAILGGGLLEWLIWLANPLSWIAWITTIQANKDRSAHSMIAFVLAISFFNWKQILVSESGQEGPITQLQAGYWLWVASIGFLLIASLINKDNLVSASPR